MSPSRGSDPDSRGRRPRRRAPWPIRSRSRVMSRPAQGQSTDTFPNLSTATSASARSPSPPRAKSVSDTKFETLICGLFGDGGLRKVFTEDMAGAVPGRVVDPACPYRTAAQYFKSGPGQRPWPRRQRAARRESTPCSSSGRSWCPWWCALGRGRHTTVLRGRRSRTRWQPVGEWRVILRRTAIR